MTEKIRIAIIGAGAVSDYHHVPGIRIDPRAELVAVCDPNEASTRRSELRKIALSRIAALEKDAKAQIEVISLEAQTELLGGGLDSLAAKTFLNKLESVEHLMPKLNAEQIRAASPSRLERILADVD